MEQIDCLRGSRKRKCCDQNGAFGVVSFDELHQDLLEKILSWLPTSTFFRLCSVSKRWRSIAASPTFRLACSQVPSREPWFFMVDLDFDAQLKGSVVFDSSEGNWKQLHYPRFLRQCSDSNFTPVAASGGLICFHSAASHEFMVCNPVSGSCRHLPKTSHTHPSLHVIAMNSSTKFHPSSYKLVLVSGELPKLSFQVYNSVLDRWGEATVLSRKDGYSSEHDTNGDETVYFLSIAGNVVSTNMQRSPWKQYSSVITLKDGEEMVYFLSSSGTIVACNLTRKCFFEYPRLLPVFSEYSIDVFECGGEMLVVVLWEFLESASLRVWRFDEDGGFWHQIAAMPPAMSHSFYGKKVDINCTGGGDLVLVCINSTELCSYVLCDLVHNEWVELSNCCINGKAKKFMSAFSFEPRIEASV